MWGYDELQKTIFDFAYGAALGDATGQKAFEGKKKPLRHNEKAKDIAREYIDGIIRGITPDFFKITEALEKSFEYYIKNNINYIKYETKDGKQPEPVFRFGNAQKLINMLAKNMFLLVYQDESLREKFKQCHCPMDNVMIDTVKRELAEKGDEEAKHLLAEYKKSEKAAWSRIERGNFEQYENFQKCVRYLASKENLSPIEYDYMMWEKRSTNQKIRNDQDS